MNTLETNRPTQDILIEYILSLGFRQACNQLHITSEQADDILYPKQVQNQYKYNTIIDKPLHKDSAKIVEVIAKHFEELKKKYTKYEKNHLYMAQDVEDYFQRAVIRSMEVGTDDLSEQSILQLFRIQFFTIKKYSQISSYTMKNKLTALEMENENGESYIPIEYQLKYNEQYEN